MKILRFCPKLICLLEFRVFNKSLVIWIIFRHSFVSEHFNCFSKKLNFGFNLLQVMLSI